ncbi:hypothetical protein [Longimicrobium sp.]|uniref:hypothetical protein n=1 Tax=Longimicrobium sp. TaxID=2029185 RepID=UPI002F94F135
MRLLFDYAEMRDADDANDKRIDLPATLREDLDAAGRDAFDVVAFSHLDNDHICGSSDFFHLDHAKKYQGGDRIKITELWVPAAVIVEDGCEDEAKIIQAEARYRLKAGAGIRVFSRPEKLESWLQKEGLTLAERSSLITDAGQLVPGFTQAEHGVEFFVHSPFASRTDEGELLDRNDDSLVLQAAFLSGGRETKLLLTADVTHEVLAEIVRVTKYKKNEARLQWDVVNLPHHCSYLSLGPDKGKEVTEPVPNVKWLYENQGQTGGLLVSTSCPIPAGESDQPPHRQAATYYKRRATALGGEFKVTMEHPKQSAPEVLVIRVDASKATIEKRILGGAAIIVNQPAPRAG